MIKTETIEKNGIKYLHTYSDAEMMIERDGVQYADAIDPYGSDRVYTETETPIKEPEIEEEEVEKQ